MYVVKNLIEELLNPPNRSKLGEGVSKTLAWAGIMRTASFTLELKDREINELKVTINRLDRELDDQYVMVDSYVADVENLENRIKELEETITGFYEDAAGECI